MQEQTISHYRIIEKVAEGGMGIVYKAEDVKLKRTVALKVLPPSYAQEEESKRRFIAEAQNASSLQHINICRRIGLIAMSGGLAFSLPCAE